MRHRYKSGMAFLTQREKADVARAQTLNRPFINFLITKGKTYAAKRTEILGSEGFSSTDEMPYVAEMLKGQIELVNLEDLDCPMTTYSEQGLVFFSIAHCNIQSSIRLRPLGPDKLEARGSKTNGSRTCCRRKAAWQKETASCFWEFQKPSYNYDWKKARRRQGSPPKRTP